MGLEGPIVNYLRKSAGEVEWFRIELPLLSFFKEVLHADVAHIEQPGCEQCAIPLKIAVRGLFALDVHQY